MRALLDTSILIASTDENEDPPDLTGIEAQISSLAISELHFGVAAASDPRARALRELRLQRILSLFGGGIPYDDGAAASFGYLTSVVIAAGQSPRVAYLDRLIASAAHSQNLALVTRDARFDVYSEHLIVIRR